MYPSGSHADGRIFLTGFSLDDALPVADLGRTYMTEFVAIEGFRGKTMKSLKAQVVTVRNYVRQ